MANSFFASDYDQVQVGGDFQALPAGGYVCRILKAKASKSKRGLPMVEAMIDIIDGDYTQYFSKRYQSNLKKYPTDAKYPNNGIIRVTAVDEEGRTQPNFKSFNTSIEESNDMQLPRHDEAYIKALKDKEIGVVFGREEFLGNDGKTHWTTKPRWYRSVETIMSGDYQVPEDQPYNGYVPSQAGSFDTFTPNSGIDSFSAAEDDIPF